MTPAPEPTGERDWAYFEAVRIADEYTDEGDLIQMIARFARTLAAESRTEGRREGIEAAARLAEKPYGKTIGAFDHDDPLMIGSQIAKAIRALLNPSGEAEAEQ